MGGIRGFALAPAVAGGLNSGLTNAINQGVKGGPPNWLSLGASMAGGFAFGAVMGTTNAGALGIPIQGMIIQSTARGVSGGIISGASGTVVVF